MHRKIKEVIFFVESPFNKRDYDRFGIELLKQNGFQVSVWDFTPIINPQVHERVNVPDPINFDGHKIFHTKEEAIERINSLNKETSLIIFFMGYTYKSLFLFRAVSKKNINYVVFMANVLPLPDVKNSFFKKTLAKIKNINKSKLLNFCFKRTPYQILGVKPAAICLAGGSKSKIYHYPVDPNITYTLWCHSLDYDLYLKEIKNAETDKDSLKNYAVFLDEYLPFHSDYIHHSISPPVSAEEYYPKLCNFFDVLEKKYKIEVIIAAHPRAHYQENTNYFGGRKIYQFQTIKLVRSSKLVILHSSTSINFAVLFKKPCIFITTDDIQRSYMGPYIERISSLLGKRSLNIDKKIELDEREIFNFDEYLYEDYIVNYIKKKESKVDYFWQIVADYLDSYTP